MKLNTPVAKGYPRNLAYSVVVQFFFLLLGALATDMGQLGIWVIYSIGIFWIMAFMIIVRRPRSPTKGDLIAIRYGFLFIFIWVVFSTSFTWGIKGWSPWL